MADSRSIWLLGQKLSGLSKTSDRSAKDRDRYQAGCRNAKNSEKRFLRLLVLWFQRTDAIFLYLDRELTRDVFISSDLFKHERTIANHPDVRFIMQ